MLTRDVHLELREQPAPEASQHIEDRGAAIVRQALSQDEVEALRDELTRLFDDAELLPREQNPDMRFEVVNRSALVQQWVGDRRVLDVIEPLLGEDCHVIASTAWRNPPQNARSHGGGYWHTDAGPHVPRPPGVPWDERIPYPIFAVNVHILLQDCPPECGPTEFIPGSHRSGQRVPVDRKDDDHLELGGQRGELMTGHAGDILFLVSDTWHRRAPTTAGDAGRFFLQTAYGRRDIAQRLRRPHEVHQLSPECYERALSSREYRAQSVVGLHIPYFYDG